MQLFLAGIESTYQENIDLFNNTFTLMSFYACNKIGIKVMQNSRDFLLDSGAFTFLQSQKKKPNTKIDFDEYLIKYIAFINKYDVKNFFELDIDSIVGYEEVKRIRTKLEKGTGKQCIPVWHMGRGIDEYLKLCEEYPRIAIGGIAIKEIKKNQWKYFQWFIHEAHKRNCKVHGLGFTSTRDLQKYHFDSVDSTSWQWGRYGYYFRQDGKIMRMFPRPEGKRGKPKEIQRYNLSIWTKYQRYAETNL